MPPNNELISEEYKRQLQDKHSSDDDWGNTGARYIHRLLEMIDAFDGKSVLDYGCGKGVTGDRFRGEQTKPGSKYAQVEFQEYDPGIPGKDSTDTSADILFNVDVLEHIEPSMLDNVLADMAKRTKKAGFLLISCRPAQHLLPDGRNAHLIVQSPDWWLKKLGEFFNLGNSGQNSEELQVVVLAKSYILPQASMSEEDQIIHQAQALIADKQLTQARLLLTKIRDFRQTPEAFFAMGDISYHTNDMALAAQYYLEYAKITSDAKAYRMAGLTFSKIENYESALKCLELPVCIKAYATDPEYLEALMLSWNKLNTPDKTIAFYEGRGQPDLPLTVQYIDALILVQRLDDAKRAAEQCAKDHPARPEAWSVLERAFTALRQFDNALEASQKAVELDPQSAVYQCNLGFCYLFLANVDNALSAFNKASEIDPLMMAPHLNRSTIHRYKKDYTDLNKDLENAYQIDPASADVHYAIGVSALKQDHYKKAFAELEWYWHKNKLTSFRMPLDIPRWYGEDLSDRTLMFYADQGVGDIIMMMRYIPEIIEKHKPKKLLINVIEKLEALFTTSFPDLFASGRLAIYNNTTQATIGGFDCVVAATSLPYVMDTDIGTIPHTQSYLKKQNDLNYKTGADKELVVGISWHTKSLDAGYIRSIKLSEFNFLAKYPNVRVIDLQYGDTSAERAQNAADGFDVYHDDSVDSWAALQPFVDQVAACDLVISIDNTTVHVAGALGVPCWTILAQEPYWRWPVSGDATPWYDSLRLFRQKSKNYADLFIELETEFKKLLTNDRGILIPAPYKSPYPQIKAKKTAVIINDTGSCYSWGHYAGMEGLKKDLKSKGFAVEGISTLELPWFTQQVPTLVDFDNPKYLASARYRDPTLFYQLEHADEVIINGEGMMNGLGDIAVRLLYLAYVAKHFYKRTVSIINHSCYPENNTALTNANTLAFYHKVYSRIDRCVVRDKYSYDLLKSIGIQVEQGADTSLLWLGAHIPTVKKTPTAVITSGIGYDSRYAQHFAALCKQLTAQGIQPLILKGAVWHVAQEDFTLARDLQELAPDDAQVVTVNNAEEFVNYLSSAQIVISGFHPVCVMAHALGTPVIPFMAGPHGLAMTGLSKISDVPAALFYEDPSIAKKLDQALKTVFDALQVTQKTQKSRFDTLHALAEKNLAAF